MPFVSNILKYSALLILSNYVFQSEQLQPCLATAKPRGTGDYSFALAQVDDYHNPLGPQEACFYSCGAEIVTQSSNRGDMSGLTLMDNAATFLTASGFLKVGESYFLNHLGLVDEEGGNGIGCIEVKPGNKINHYPKNHAVCTMAKAAVCGFWGQQVIPPQPKEVKPKPQKTATQSKKPKPTRKPKPKPKTTPAIAVTKSKPVGVVSPISTSAPVVQPSTPIAVVPNSSQIAATNVVVTEVVTAPAIPSASPIVSKVQSVSVVAVTGVFTEYVLGTYIDPLPSPTSAVNEIPAGGNNTPISEPGSEAIDTFKVNGRAFHVINKFEKSLASADNTCVQNQAEIASVTSQSLTAVSEKLKELSQGKVIIGTWNGDGYSLSGNNCLILQTNHGIYPGTCSDATAILCQSI